MHARRRPRFQGLCGRLEWRADQISVDEGGQSEAEIHSRKPFNGVLLNPSTDIHHIDILATSIVQKAATNI